MFRPKTPSLRCSRGGARCHPISRLSSRRSCLVSTRCGLRATEQNVGKQRELLGWAYRPTPEMEVQSIAVERHEQDIGELTRTHMIEAGQAIIEEFRQSFLDRQPQRRAIAFPRGRR